MGVKIQKRYFSFFSLDDFVHSGMVNTGQGAVSQRGNMRNGRYEENGNVYWYRNGLHHREDGPAIEYSNGYKEWLVDGEPHRLDGPAIEYSDGDTEWYANGKLHRLDGPAYVGENGDTEWCIDGQLVDIVAIFGYEPSVPLSEEEQVILRLSI